MSKENEMRAHPIPANIRDAVNALIGPYNVDIADLLQGRDREQRFVDRFMTVAEAARYARVSRWTLDRALKANHIRAIKLSKAKSGKVLIEKKSIDEWFEARRIYPASANQHNDKEKS